jgi:hypothetical protein
VITKLLSLTTGKSSLWDLTTMVNSDSVRNKRKIRKRLEVSDTQRVKTDYTRRVLRRTVEWVLSILEVRKPNR